MALTCREHFVSLMKYRIALCTASGEIIDFDKDHIVSTMFLADIGDTLTVWDMRYQGLGTIDLIYGSGRDVIHGHTDMPLISTLVVLARAEVIAPSSYRPDAYRVAFRHRSPLVSERTSPRSLTSIS
jgi:hypothetical protein